MKLINTIFSAVDLDVGATNNDLSDKLSVV